MAQQYDLEKNLGFSLGTVPVAWTQRDLLLYAVGIGATSSDLPLVFELDKNWAPFPTFPCVLGFKGDNPEVVDFNASVNNAPVNPNLPKFPPGRIVHGWQSIEVLKPLPQASGPGWKLRKTIVGVHENKSGVIVDVENLLLDPQDVPYSRMIAATFNVGAKVNGSKFDKVIQSPPKASQSLPKDRAPDFTAKQIIRDEQAITYRLSGDYNPLHIDPTVGQKAGFGGVILHGLCSYGMSARHIVQAVAGGKPSALKALSARFTSPVKLGDELETSVWKIGGGPDGTTEYAFVTKNLTSGKLALGGGLAYVVDTGKSKL